MSLEAKERDDRAVMEEKILDTLRSGGPMGPQEILGALAKKGFSEWSSRDYIWHLLDQGRIIVNREGKIEAS